MIPVLNFFACDASLRGGVRVVAKDFNGDGKTDLITGSGNTGLLYVGSNTAGWYGLPKTHRISPHWAAPPERVRTISIVSVSASIASSAKCSSARVPRTLSLIAFSAAFRVARNSARVAAHPRTARPRRSPDQSAERRRPE